MVSIDSQKCIGCGACVKDCFFQVLHLENGKAAVSGDCFRCGHCIAVCPKNAVSITDYPMDEVQEYDAETFALKPENLLHFIQFRRTVRQFKQEPIPRNMLEMILEAGRYTPTAANRQDVSYIMIQERLEELQPILWDGLAEMLKQGVAGPFAYRMQHFCDAHAADPNEDRLFCHANAMLLVLAENPLNGGLAASSMELMAQAQGVGVLYSGFLQRTILATPKAKEFLGMDDSKTLCACMLLGLSDVKYHRTVPRKKAHVTWK